MNYILVKADFHVNRSRPADIWYYFNLLTNEAE